MPYLSRLSQDWLLFLHDDDALGTEVLFWDWVTAKSRSWFFPHLVLFILSCFGRYSFTRFVVSGECGMSQSCSHNFIRRVWRRRDFTVRSRSLYFTTATNGNTSQSPVDFEDLNYGDKYLIFIYILQNWQCKFLLRICLWPTGKRKLKYATSARPRTRTVCRLLILVIS